MSLPLMFALLLFGHYLFDFSLQGEFVALGKNPFNSLPGIPWFHCMFAHAFLHAMVVLFITGKVWCFFFELVVHFVVDVAKCAGKITFTEDQWAHVLCKGFYVVAIICWGIS